MDHKIKHIISLGAGVQSSTMALMAAAGEITPMPTAAIFADTQAEPEGVYSWLDWLEKQLPFPVYRVTKGSLEARALEMHVTQDGRAYPKAEIPLFCLNPDGSAGKIRNRNCTRDFKIVPILRQVRELAAIKRGEKEIRVIQWIGISLDEVYRMKPSRENWCKHRWPLVDAGMKRNDCFRWMESHGFPKPPRSACVFCPYHNDNEWRRLQGEEPAEFKRACDFEQAIQEAKSKSSNFRSTPFLHRSLKPLSSIDFSTDEERGQGDLWNNECEGMCGV